MRKWRNFTSLHSTVLTQEQEDYIGVKVEGPFKGGHYRHSVSCFIRGCCLKQHFRFSGSGRTLRGSSSSAGRPRHESSIAKNYLKSSSIEKNYLRSISTWTSGVHRDKESLPNSPKLHSLTRFQPGHQPENWRALQEEETAQGSVSISSGTSGRCSCRNFGTCIITLMHLRVLYIVMVCSGTSVRSTRRRRGAKPLAVAAAAIRVGEDVAASHQPSVAAAALFRLPSSCSQFAKELVEKVSYSRTRSLWKCQSRECCALGTTISFPTVNPSELASGRLLNLGGAPSHLSFEMSCSFTIQVLAQLDLLRNFAFLHSVTGSLCFLRWSVLASSRLLNLSCTTGQTSFGMSCSFTVQVLSQLDLLKKVTRIKAYKNDFQLLPKELDAEALDGEELLPIELLEFTTTPAGALDGEELLVVELEMRLLEVKSRAQVARELPPSPQGRLRHQRPRSAGYDCVNNATVRKGRV